MSNTISGILPGMQATPSRVNKGKALEAEPQVSGQMVSGRGTKAPLSPVAGDHRAATPAMSSPSSSGRTAANTYNITQEQTAIADDKVKAFAEVIAKELEEVALANDHTGIRVQTDVHEETGRYIVRVIESDTGKVIREFPPMEYLDVVAALDELEGLFLEEEL